MENILVANFKISDFLLPTNYRVCKSFLQIGLVVLLTPIVCPSFLAKSSELTEVSSAIRDIESKGIIGRASFRHFEGATMIDEADYNFSFSRNQLRLEIVETNRTFFFVRNADYGFWLSRGERKDTFVVNEIEHAGLNYRRAEGFMGYIIPQYSIGPQRLSWAIGSKTFKVVTTGIESDGLVKMSYECDEMFADGRTRPRISMWLDSQSNFSVQRYEGAIRVNKENGWFTGQVEYARSNDSRTIPSKVTIHFFDSEKKAKNLGSYVIEYTNWRFDEVRDDVFRLKDFGLPEPISGHFQLSKYGLLIFLVIFAIVVLFYNRAKYSRRAR